MTFFKDKSESKADNSLSVEYARQVCTHPNWVRENLPVDKDALIVPILLTPVLVADDAALPHLKDVLVWNLDEFRKWAHNAIAVVRELRKEYPNSGDLVWRALAAEKLTAACVTPESLLAMLKDRVGSVVLKKD